MTLKVYLQRSGAKSLTKLAEEMRVSKGRLSQLRDSTDWPPDLALAAEGCTGGALNASDLSPVIRKARETGVSVAA